MAKFLVGYFLMQVNTMSAPQHENQTLEKFVGMGIFLRSNACPLVTPLRSSVVPGLPRFVNIVSRSNQLYTDLKIPLTSNKSFKVVPQLASRCKLPFSNISSRVAKQCFALQRSCSTFSEFHCAYVVVGGANSDLICSNSNVF
jgi:hypothetical protein